MIKITSLVLALMPAFALAATPPEKTRCDAEITGSSPAAVPLCRSWLDLALTGTSPDEKASAELDYATALEASGRAGEALRHCEQASQWAQLSQSPLAIAMTSGALVRHYYQAKDFARMMPVADQAIDSHGKLLGRSHPTSLALIALRADARRLSGDPQGALADADAALASASDSNPGHTEVMAQLLNIRALSLDKTGQAKAALPEYLRAAKLMEKVNAGAAVTLWRNVRSAWTEATPGADTTAIDERIAFLMRQASGQNQDSALAPNVSLAFDDASVKP
jgi:tetratricopeptide (TPR) repeat protein